MYYIQCKNLSESLVIATISDKLNQAESCSLRVWGQSQEEKASYYHKVKLVK